MATSSSAIQKKIETLKKGLNNKFITAAQKEKIKAQVQKLESQSKASAPKKATKPAASSSLTRLQKLVKNKKYGVYKGAGVDLKKDSDRPAKAIGKRTAKSGKTYYEYRANRIDVKQPPKRYPKLEKGGYMAKGGMFEKPIPAIMDKFGNVKSEKQLEQDLKYLKEAYEDKLVTKDEYEKSYNEIKEQIKFLQSKEKGGYMADGGKVRSQEEFNKLVAEKEKLVKNLSPKEVAEMWNKNSNSPSKMTEEEGKMSNSRMYLADLLVENELTEAEHSKYFEKGGYMAEGGRVKGRNNETGETYGVVIGSVQKSDEDIEGGTEMNVRKGYSSRISEVKLVFDKNGNLYQITDYGCALEGNYPDTSRGSGRNYNADKKETLEVLSKKYNPAFAKKLIELAKNPKMAEGGMTEHGLRIGDKITTDMFWDNQIVVENTKTNKRAQIDLETGKRKDEMEKGGYMAKGGDISVYNLRKGDKVKTRKGDIETIIRKTGSGSYETIESEYTHSPESLEFVSRPGRKMEDGGEVSQEISEKIITYLDSYIKKYDSLSGYIVPIKLVFVESVGEGDDLIMVKHNLQSEFEYQIERAKNNKSAVDDSAKDILKIYSKVMVMLDGYMADGGVTEKEVVESNADMVLSQIKAVKHHAEELSSVVSRKSNIEAWVVGKIERASTDLSDITHYLEGNKDKMSMGGTVRYYAHKMDKK
jgi:hypothetical protein